MSPPRISVTAALPRRALSLLNRRAEAVLARGAVGLRPCGAETVLITSDGPTLLAEITGLDRRHIIGQFPSAPIATAAALLEPGSAGAEQREIAW